MATATDHQRTDDTQLVASPIGLVDSGDFRNQSGAAIEDDDTNEEIDETELDDEPIDEDGDPTGEHDHHQDDNYALGGHVTRSGSV